MARVCEVALTVLEVIVAMMYCKLGVRDGYGLGS